MGTGVAAAASGGRDGGVALQLTLILTIGKYVLLALLYAFVLVVFRGIIRQLATDTQQGSEAGASRRRVQRQRPGRSPAAAPRILAEEPEEAHAPAVMRDAEPEGDPAGEPPPPPSEPRPAPTDVAEQTRAPRLVVIESDGAEPQEGEEVPLSAAVTIGRSEENSLQLDDRFVSGRHALICLRDGRRILVDRGSTNGTFVNGERVADELELQDHDRIALGNTVFEYRAG